MKITAELLRTHGACEKQAATFERHWPNGVTPNVRTLAKARRLGLDVEWCECLLSAPALAEYQKVTAPAWAEYQKVRDAALAEYQKVTAAAWAEYQKVTAPAVVAALRAQ